ncbi:MAG: cisplatin damage response ATP-dependent DNA ligase [Pseudomonadota bacterium]|nr:cisplatin damage response ATP-dependent DNA ligase [Pseudomonadota bacterium]
MKRFAALLETLILTPSRNRKIATLQGYFAAVPDPDRGLAVAAITRDLTLHHVKPALLRGLTESRVDPVLFNLSYDYVGDLAETVALIWPRQRGGVLPSLGDFVAAVESLPKDQIADQVAAWLDIATPNERRAMIKLATGGLRVGVSARLAKTALAAYGGQPLAEIEHIWHGIKPPYDALFAWLDGRAARPEVDHTQTFHPMMLAHPIDLARDLEGIAPGDFQAEWKWDGIRVQVITYGGDTRVFSRTGDDITRAFPDLADNVRGAAVLDGELLVGADFQPLDFNCLQQRLNRKTPLKSHLSTYPAFVRAYDMLFDGDEDIRALPLVARRRRLAAWLTANSQSRIDLSAAVRFADWDHLAVLRATGTNSGGHEGLMLKRADSAYVAGRPKGLWFKWKRDPKVVDAVIMYAQRGHGKRSSYYSDFTFGVWRDDVLVPIGKAYSGFTDVELGRLDKFVRSNTVARFGPVREVAKTLVVEVAFDSAHASPRHKSGIALRFPRISRIRWDKPAGEVESLAAIKAQLLAAEG